MKQGEPQGRQQASSLQPMCGVNRRGGEKPRGRNEIGEMASLGHGCLARDVQEWTHTVADGGVEDARAHREMVSGRTPGEEIHGSTWVRARGESSGEELDQRGSSSSIAARRGRKRGRGENLEDTSTPASGANPERERQGRGGSEQRPTSSRRPGSRDTTDMTCWKPHDLDVRGNPRRAGLRTKASCFGRL